MRLSEAIIYKPDNITYRELDGEGVLYDMDSKSMHVLNKTALAVWNLCDAEEDPQGIARVLAARHGIPEQRILPDVLECLNRFEELGLIRRTAQ